MSCSSGPRWPARAKPPADLIAGIVAFSIVVGLAWVWRWLYWLCDAGLLVIAALGAMALAGSYVAAMQRRRALMAAVFIPGSRLAWLFAGRLSAGLAALVGTLAALPGFAFFTLTASPVECALFLGLVAAAMTVFVGLRRLLSAHLRPSLRSAFCAPWAIGTTAALFLPAHAYAVYALMPLPPYVDAPTLGEAVQMALGTLPAREHLPAELLALFEAGEAAALWALVRTEFAWLALIPYLALGATIGFGLARVAVDVATLFVARADREGDGLGNSWRNEHHS